MVRQSKKPIGNLRKLLQELREKAKPRRKLTAEEAKRLNKLEAIAGKLKRGENVQNRQLQTWLSEGEYSQIEAEWDTQKLFREEFKDKPSESEFMETPTNMLSQRALDRRTRYNIDLDFKDIPEKLAHTPC